jgi:hypothetical protein
VSSCVAPAASRPHGRRSSTSSDSGTRRGPSRRARVVVEARACRRHGRVLWSRLDLLAAETGAKASTRRAAGDIAIRGRTCAGESNGPEPLVEFHQFLVVFGVCGGRPLVGVVPDQSDSRSWPRNLDARDARPRPLIELPRPGVIPDLRLGERGETAQHRRAGLDRLDRLGQIDVEGARHERVETSTATMSSSIRTRRLIGRSLFRLAWACQQRKTRPNDLAALLSKRAE